MRASCERLPQYLQLPSFCDACAKHDCCGEHAFAWLGCGRREQEAALTDGLDVRSASMCAADSSTGTTKSEDVFQGRERAEGEELLPQSFRANASHNARNEPGVKAGRAQICGGGGEFFLVHGKVVERLIVLLLRSSNWTQERAVLRLCRCTHVKVIRVEVSQNVLHTRTKGWLTSTRSGIFLYFGLRPRRSNPRRTICFEPSE